MRLFTVLAGVLSIAFVAASADANPPSRCPNSRSSRPTCPAGAGRGNFNHQFAQPSRDARPFFNFYYATDIFPFTDLKQLDPVTGLEGGILVRAEQDNVVPKIFYTNSAYEYYGRAASLMHTTLDGSADAPLGVNTRLYVMAGGNHGPGSVPPVRRRSRRRCRPSPLDWHLHGRHEEQRHLHRTLRRADRRVVADPVRIGRANLSTRLPTGS
jgi:hypothetical protein